VNIIWDEVFVAGGGFGHLELMSLCHSVVLMMLAAERGQSMNSLLKWRYRQKQKK
jgi:hypothetical protein